MAEKKLTGEAKKERRREQNRKAQQAWRRRQGIKPRPVKGCGTYAGFFRHRRAGEPICESCRAAENEYRRARR